MDAVQMKKVVEALLMASPRPLQFNELAKLLAHDGKMPDRATLGEVLAALEAECDGRAVELRQVASGYRYQTREDYAPWLAKLWEEKPPRYSRALLETLALIAYRQPITRAAIEEVRGVSVSTGTVRILEERGWIEVAGYKETPGRPALYATTRAFLDDFNLRSLDELPALAAPGSIAGPDAAAGIAAIAAPAPAPEDTPQDAPQDAPQGTPQDTPQDTSQDTPQDAPQDTPQDTPANAAELSDHVAGISQNTNTEVAG